MTRATQTDFESQLRQRLKGARKVAVVGIGDELDPHDRLGMVAAREVERLHLPRVAVFLASTVPESVTGPVRRLRPDHVLLVDAADMGVRPGTVAVLPPKDVQARLLSTHALPLPVVMEFLGKDTKARVTLIGIQPNLEHAGPSPCTLEEAGLARFVSALQRTLGAERPAGMSRAL